MINSLSIGDSTPTDADYYISQYVGGGTTYTTYHRRPMSALWNYIKSKLATVATSGSYNDLSNKPTIPTVGNGTVTIKQAGTSKGTFTMNQSGNTTIELTDNNTDTKVTAVGNHYTPSGGTTTSASGGTLTDITNSSSGVNVVTGVTKDAAGHITGVTSLALKSVNTVYTHPSTHPATMITEDSTHRFVTDTEKTTWNNKASKDLTNIDNTTFKSKIEASGFSSGTQVQILTWEAND